jgi:hAT family C-terminal dimerisation region
MCAVLLQVCKGLLTMAERLLSEDEAVDALVELKNYRSQEGTFGSSVVRRAAKRMAAFEWWRDHGASAPAFKKLAMKVLSQVGSACSCEHSWSHYGFIHNRLRNRLKPGRAEDLVYVFSNLRLLRSVESREEFEYHLWDVEEDL